MRVQVNNLVLVHKPNTKDMHLQKTSRNLVYQFKGPFRIVAFKGPKTVKLETVDNQPKGFEHINNCFPYNREQNLYLTGKHTYVCLQAAPGRSSWVCLLLMQVHWPSSLTGGYLRSHAVPEGVLRALRGRVR